MKFNTKLISAAFVGLLFSGIELAHAATITVTLKQVGAVSPDSGMLRITTPVNENALPACAQNSSDGLSTEIFFFNKSGDAESHGKDLLSLALAAFISETSIQLTYSDLYCIGSRANVSRIDLIK